MNNNTKQPSPEERQRIVNAATAEFLAKQKLAENDFTRMVKYRNDARTYVYTLTKAILDSVQMLPPTDQRSPHSPTGRAMLGHQIAKYYLDWFVGKGINREEALYLLAYAWADLTLQDFV